MKSYLTKKLTAAILAAAMIIGQAMPAVAMTIATRKENTDFTNVYAYNLTNQATYAKQIPEDADYSKGIYILDDLGNVHLAADSEHIYAGGLGIDNQYYDESGNRVNCLSYIKNKYYTKYLQTGENSSVRFENKADMTLFMYYYIMEYATNQSLAYTYTHYDNAKYVDLNKTEITKFPTTLSEAYQNAVAEDVAKIDLTKPFNERLIQAVNLTYDRFTYDETYTDADINQAITDKKGVCFHFAKYFNSLMKTLGYETGYEIGCMNGQQNPNNIHVWNTIKDPEMGKTYYADTTAPANSENLINDPFAYLSVYTPAGIKSEYVKKIGDK